MLRVHPWRVNPVIAVRLVITKGGYNPVIAVRLVIKVRMQLTNSRCILGSRAAQAVFRGAGALTYDGALSVVPRPRCARPRRWRPHL
jgi:hypothetical protein